MRILLCDDHALFREGLELVMKQLDDEVELIGVGDAEAALAHLAEDDDLDLVLLDLGLPGMDGFGALAELRRRHVSVPVVLLSASERPQDVRSALEGGASGFIPKSTRGSVLRGAIELVLSGGVYVPPLMLDAPQDVRPSDANELSPRQVEVLRLLARGLTNKEVAGVLGIAEGTVKSHVMRIYEVLEVSNRTEAAMRMRELGLDD
jgi:two-component system nitrate/nitrite response regulator NarL